MEFPPKQVEVHEAVPLYGRVLLRTTPYDVIEPQ